MPIPIKTFLRLTACTTGLIGATLLIMPSFIADFFFAATDHTVDIFIQFVGSSLIGYTYLNWQTAKASHPGQLHATLIGNFSSLFIAWIVSLAGVLNGTLKATGWFIVALHFVFGIGFAYFLSKEPMKVSESQD
jgi:hypothetical protein